MWTDKVDEEVVARSFDDIQIMYHHKTAVKISLWRKKLKLINS